VTGATPAERRRPRWSTLAFAGGATALALLLLPSIRGWFVEIGQRWAYILLVSSTTALAVTPLTIALGRRWGLVDQPSVRKIHLTPTPRLGGLAVYLGFVASVLVNAILEEWMVAVLVVGTLLLVVGIVDDKLDLAAWVKLAVQLGSTALVIHAGVVLTLLPAGPVGTAVNLFLTVLWIVGITNALNFLDGMDGLATGLAILIAFFLGLVAFQTHQPGLGWVALAVLGASLGFLPYNFRNTQPALVFLGDGGSTFLGFTLACLAVKGNWAENHPLVSFSNPLLIFGVLIYDMIHITVERVATGKVRSVKEWIDYVGKDHMHHRLERALGSRRASVAMILALTVCLGLAAMVLRKADLAEAVMLLGQAAIIVSILTALEYRGRPEYRQAHPEKYGLEAPDGRKDRPASTAESAPAGVKDGMEREGEA
jgi:UDP-GlcNAc:undecaprenyl-phosphate GlcNAc-1-phosphate transferase